MMPKLRVAVFLLPNETNYLCHKFVAPNTPNKNQKIAQAESYRGMGSQWGALSFIIHMEVA